MQNKTIIFLIILAVSLVSFNSVAAQTATSTPDITLQAIIQQLQDQITKLQSQITELKAELETIKSEIIFTKTLKKGDSGEDVKQLQKFLKGFPDIYPEGLVTGYFGPLTEVAVKKLQKKQGIETLGVVGPKTITKINELLTQNSSASSAISQESSVVFEVQKKPDKKLDETTTAPLPATINIPPLTPAVPATPNSSFVSETNTNLWNPGTNTPAVPATPATPAIPATPATPAVPTPTPTPTPTTTGSVCPNLNLYIGKTNATLGETTFTIGETVWYKYVCYPSGSGAASYIGIHLVKPNGTAPQYNYTTNVTTNTLGFGTDNLVAGNYTIRACFDANCTLVSATINFTLVQSITIPTAPSNLSATPVNNNANVNLSWTGTTSGVTEFRIYQRLQGSSWPSSYERRGLELILSISGNTITVQVGSPTNGGTYEYKVQACNSAGCSNDSNIVIVTLITPDTTPPSVPNLTATLIPSTSSSIELSWSASIDNIGVIGYYIYRNGVLLSPSLTLTSYRDINLSPGTTYTYTVSAHDAAWNHSAQSSPVSITTSTDVTPPVISSISASSITANSVIISWTTDEPADSMVEYGLTAPAGADSGYGTLKSDSSLVTSHSISFPAGLQAATLYHYRVWSNDAAGNRGFSGDNTFTTAPSPSARLDKKILNQIASILESMRGILNQIQDFFEKR